MSEGVTQAICEQKSECFDLLKNQIVFGYYWEDDECVPVDAHYEILFPWMSVRF